MAGDTENDSGGTKLYKCHLPGCKSRPFSSQSALSKHLKEVHSTERPFKCDFANCTSQFKSAQHLRTHSRKVHKIVNTFKCVIPGCTESFATHAEMKGHIKPTHGEKPYRCDFPECVKSFKDNKALGKHKRTVHTDERPYKCEFPGCDKDYKQYGALKQHVRASHEGLRPFRCEFPGCTSQPFSRKWSLDFHVKTKHEGHKPFPCSECDKGFIEIRELIRHLKQHGHEMPFKCPSPGCKSAFPAQNYLDRHWNVHHAENPLRFGCQICGKLLKSPDGLHAHELRHTHYGCPIYFCGKLFETAEEALAHAEDPNHDSGKIFYSCPLPNCRLAVAGKVFLRKYTLKAHWATHVAHGDVSPDVELEYKTAKLPQFFRGPLFDAIFKHRRQNEVVADPHQAIEGDEDYRMEEESGEESEEDSYAVASMEQDFVQNDSDEEDTEDEDGQQDEDTANDSDDDDRMEDESDDENYLGDEYDSEDSEDDFPEEADEPREDAASVFDQNTELFDVLKDTKPISLNARGFTCIGPGLKSRYLVDEPCPEHQRIDEESAFIREYRSADIPTMRMDTRCALCRQIRSIRRWNQRMGRGQEDLDVDFKLYRRTILETASKTWTLCQTDYKVKVRRPVIKLRNSMKQGPVPPKVVIIDCEWSMPDRRLCEVAIIDRATRKVLLNTLIKRSKMVQLPEDMEKYPAKTMRLFRSHEAKLYRNSKKSELMDVDQVAQELQRLGITPKTVFVAWHKSRTDLSLFRNFLEEGGHKGILPGDDMCLPMVPYFRHNIPKGFSLSLPVIFEVLYPGHKLIGHNHRALPDCEQTMLVLDAFEQLCKPSERRTHRWKFETIQELYESDD